MDRLTAAQVFVTIVEQGTMAAAGERLDMSRSMITRYLSEMENWAGSRLLHRSTRRLSLTSAGEAALLHCRQLLDVADYLPALSDADLSGPQGLLRISCSQYLAQEELAPLIKQYLRDYPQTSVDFHISGQVLDLVAERIDLAIRISQEIDPNLIARPLGVCRSVICATPEYLAEHDTPHTLQALSQHNCLTYSYFGNSLWSFNRDGEPCAIAVRGNFSANDSMVVLGATLNSVGIAMQPRHSVIEHIRSGRLVQLLPEYEPQTLNIYGVYHSRKKQPASLRMMLDRLVEYFAENDN